MPIVIPALIVLVLVFLTQLPKVIDFINSGSIGNVADTNSKLRYVVSPLETLGIWASGNWLLGTHDVSHFWIFGAIGIAGTIVGLVWWVAKRDYAVPAAVISGLIVYLLTKYIESGGLYILAKAVVVPASVDAAGGDRAAFAGRRLAEADFAVVFIAWPGTQPSAPRHRDSWTTNHDEPVQARGGRSEGPRPDGDRFVRPAIGRGLSPAFNAEIRVPSAVTKSQRLPIDFDSVPARVLNDFPYASPPARSTRARRRRWTLVDSTPSYRL
jgi:hypothetical protein